MAFAKLIINSILTRTRASVFTCYTYKTIFQCNLLLFPRASSSRYLLMLCFSIIPLCPDPAISSVQHGFTRSVCRTVRGQYSQGKQHCAWTSCREGCTHEVYTCWQIEVSTVQYSAVQYSTVQAALRTQLSARWSTTSTTRTRAWWPPRPANSSPT